MNKIKTALIIALSILVLALGIAYATSVEISREVPGGITINNIIPPTPTSEPPKGDPDERADIDGNGVIDFRDLQAIARKLNTHPASGMDEDVNQDGTIDVLDLAIAARFLGQEVQI